MPLFFKTPSPMRRGLTPSHTLPQQCLWHHLISFANSFWSLPWLDPPPFSKPWIHPCMARGLIVCMWERQGVSLCVCERDKGFHCVCETDKGFHCVCGKGFRDTPVKIVTRPNSVGPQHGYKLQTTLPRQTPPYKLTTHHTAHTGTPFHNKCIQIIVEITLLGVQYLIHMEQCLVLWYQRIPWFCQYPHQHVRSQWVKGHNDRKAAHELWDHSKLYHIPGLHLSQCSISLFHVFHSITTLIITAQVSPSGSTPTLLTTGWSTKAKVLCQQKTLCTITVWPSSKLPSDLCPDTINSFC